MAQRMCARMSTRLSRLYVQATEPNSKGRYHRLYDILHLLPRYYLLLKLKWSSHCIVSALQLSNIYDLALALPSAMVLQHMLITLSPSLNKQSKTSGDQKVIVGFICHVHDGITIYCKDQDRLVKIISSTLLAIDFLASRNILIWCLWCDYVNTTSTSPKISSSVSSAINVLRRTCCKNCRQIK